jgi:RNA polymerase sigma factor (sigma-70 family)
MAARVAEMHGPILPLAEKIRWRLFYHREEVTMSVATLAAFIARCRILCRPHKDSTDAELLERFTRRRDADAFTQILERYAGLVWGVCQRIVPQESDCEDVFQAVFLAMVGRPDLIDPRQSLGAWLHTVAIRMSRKALLRSHRQQPRRVVPERATTGDVADEVSSRELFRIVDEEIERLPIAVRVPLILCCLEGRTRDEAAAVLGCSVAAVKSRLERGRDQLRRRLERRGVQLPAAFLVLGLTSERIRAALWAKTMQAALYTPAPAIAALADAALPVGKGKLIVAAMLLAVSAAGVAGPLLTTKPREIAEPVQQVKGVAEPNKPQVRTDGHGDPLPDGAIARLGTVRWQHGYTVGRLAYSPDGKRIAATGIGRDITLWDARTGNEIQQFPHNGRQSMAVAFAPDGKYLATADGRGVHLWDVATGKEVRQLKGDYSVSFSPDGKHVATTNYDGVAQIWDVSTGKDLHQLSCNQGKALRVAYSPDGTLLATAGEDGTIRLWDAATTTERRRINGHTREVFLIHFLVEGKLLASASEDKTVRFWDVATGRQCRILEVKREENRLPIAFSPDGNVFASGHKEGIVRLWDPLSGTEKRSWRVGRYNVWTMVFAPDGKTLATGTIFGGGIRLWDVATGKEQHPSDAHHGIVNLIQHSADGAVLFSFGSDEVLLRWDLTAKTPTQLFSLATEHSEIFALSPDGNTVAVSGWPDSYMRLCDVRIGKPVCALGKPRKVTQDAVAFSPDGRLVAAQVDNGLIRVWDVPDGREVGQMQGFQRFARRLRFSPDCKALAGGLDWMGIATAPESTVRLWDVLSGKELAHFDSPSSLDGELLAFSPGGKILASSTSNNRDKFIVHLWDTASGRELCRYTEHRDRVRALAFSPDGKRIASGSGSADAKDNFVHVWETATGRQIRRFAGHHSGIESMDFAPDGLTMASGAGDSTILLWDITGRRSDGRWHAKPLTPSQLDACWTALANEDAATAYDAVWALVAAPGQAVPFLQKHLPPVPHPNAKIVSRLIADLDSDDFLARRRATDELSKLGDAIAPALRRALDGKPSLEVRRRVQQLLDQTRDWTTERWRDHRAIQALEHIGRRQAKQVLLKLADGASGAYRTEAAKAALQRPTFTSPFAE